MYAMLLRFHIDEWVSIFTLNHDALHLLWERLHDIGIRFIHSPQHVIVSNRLHGYDPARTRMTGILLHDQQYSFQIVLMIELHVFTQFIIKNVFEFVLQTVEYALIVFLDRGPI